MRTYPCRTQTITVFGSDRGTEKFAEFFVLRCLHASADSFPIGAEN